MRLKTGVVVGLLSSAPAWPADVKLFSMSITHKAEAGEVLANYKVTYTEIERTETTSLVEIVHTPARYSDQGDFFAAMCGLLRARGERFMLGTLRTVSTEPLRQEVTFVKSGPDTVSEQLRAGIISMQQCGRLPGR
jgi:hypothetical protein